MALRVPTANGSLNDGFDYEITKHPKASYAPPLAAVQIALLPVDKAYILLSDTFAFLSTFGCLFIIFCYMYYRGIRTTSRLLLMCLSFANLFVYGSTILQSSTYYRTIDFPNERSFICQTAAGLLVFSQVSTALWTVAVTFYLFLCVTARSITMANRLPFIFQVFCWIMPFVVAMCADLSGVFGYDSTDLLVFHHPTPCWLSGKVSNPVPWYLITIEGWVMAAYCIGSLLYFPILWSTLRQRPIDRESGNEEVIEQLGIETANEQLRFIPVIYVCTRIWGTGYFLFTRYPDDRHLRAFDWLLILKGIGDNSQGLVNAICFCLATKHIRKLLSRKFERCCSCFCSWCRDHRIVGNERWMRVPQIVRTPRVSLQRKRTLDGSDIDISGISLDIPIPEADLGKGDEDDILFEQ